MQPPMPSTAKSTNTRTFFNFNPLAPSSSHSLSNLSVVPTLKSATFYYSLPNVLPGSHFSPHSIQCLVCCLPCPGPLCPHSRWHSKLHSWPCQESQLNFPARCWNVLQYCHFSLNFLDIFCFSFSFFLTFFLFSLWCWHFLPFLKEKKKKMSCYCPLQGFHCLLRSPKILVLQVLSLKALISILFLL